MAAWRTLGACLVALVLAGGAWGQTYSLSQRFSEGDCARYHLEMNLSGEMHVIKEDKPLSLKLSATAAHDFTERILIVTAGVPQKTARVYDAAKAVIQVDANRSERVLRPSRNLLVAERTKDQTVFYCPKGPLTPEELELTSGHFDVMALPGLLPNRSVAVKEAWKVSTEAAQGLCHLEGVTTQDLTCKLEAVKENVAIVSVAGSVTGIDAGAQAKMTVTASYQFDLTAKRLVHLEWKQKDDRAQGPVSPASTIDTGYYLKSVALDQPESLSDVALISVPPGLDVPEDVLNLVFHDARGRFNLKYSRDWQVVGQTDEHLVMRLMDRGDFVSQVTITPWERAKPGQHLSPEAFAREMANTPGWQQTAVLQVGELNQEKGRWTYRLSAMGTMDDMKLMQNFYLVAAPTGEQMVFAFTLTPAQVDKLGGRDQALVINAEVPGPALGE